jgi:hypothetical protein
VRSASVSVSAASRRPAMFASRLHWQEA